MVPSTGRARCGGPCESRAGRAWSAARPCGRLFVYPFRPDGEGRFEPSYEVGHGFTGYELVASLEWDTDGGSTVLAINSATGALRQFLARGEATLSGGQTIGSGWSTFSDVVACLLYTSDA